MNAMSSTPALRRAHWQQTMLRGTLSCEEPTERKKNELNLGPGQGHLDPSPTLHPPTSDAVLLLFLASMID